MLPTWRQRMAVRVRQGWPVQRIIDPRNAEIMVVAYDLIDRLKAVRILGAQYRYTYPGRETVIEDEAERVTRDHTSKES